MLTDQFIDIMMKINRCTNELEKHKNTQDKYYEYNDIVKNNAMINERNIHLNNKKALKQKDLELLKKELYDCEQIKKSIEKSIEEKVKSAHQFASVELTTKTDEAIIGGFVSVWWPRFIGWRKARRKRYKGLVW